MSDKVTTGSGGFSGGISPFDDPFVELCCCCCCLAGSGGGRSSPDDELIVDATLFCDGDEQTPPSPPLDGRLAVDDRLSLTASERSGRLAVNCCVNSITTDGDWASGGGLAFTVSDEDEASSEWALEPDWIETKGAAFNTKRHTPESTKRENQLVPPPIHQTGGNKRVGGDSSLGWASHSWNSGWGGNNWMDQRWRRIGTSLSLLSLSISAMQFQCGAV